MKNQIEHNESLPKDKEGLFCVRPFSPSVLKAFYLVTFSLTSLGVAWGIFTTYILFWENSQSNHSSNWEIYALAFFAFIYVLSFLIHMTRLYISLEELENPFSDEHQKFIKPINLLEHIKDEQLIRIFLFGIVSCKYFELLGNTRSGIFLYLFFLYGTMLTWDVFIYKKAANIKAQDLFFKISVPGTIVMLFLLILSFIDTSGKASSNLVSLLFGIMSFATWLSLLTEKPSLSDTWKKVCAYFQALRMQPYFGEQCVIKTKSFIDYQDVKETLFHGNKCIQENCNIIKVNKKVLDVANMKPKKEYSPVEAAPVPAKQ